MLALAARLVNHPSSRALLSSDLFETFWQMFGTTVPLYDHAGMHYTCRFCGQLDAQSQPKEHPLPTPRRLVGTDQWLFGKEWKLAQVGGIHVRMVGVCACVQQEEGALLSCSAK